MGELWSDLRFAARKLRRSPGFTLAAVGVLGLGIGANATVFTAVRAVLLAPPPYASPERLALLELTDSSTADPAPPRAFPWSYPKFQVLAASSDALVDPVAAFGRRSVTLTGAGDPVVVAAEVVTPAYFDVLQVAPPVGRGFAASDDTGDAPPTAILSDGLWRERFGADAGVVGRDIELNGREVTVIGVAPPGFRGLTGAGRLWLPVHTGATLIAPLLVRGAQAHWLLAIGRMPDGVEMSALRTRMREIGRRVDETYPGSEPGSVWSGGATSLMEARVNPDAERSLLILSVAAALLLLVACTNLAGLLVARAMERRRETAVRVALGSGRWRLARSAIVESLMLAAVGGLVALGVARLSVSALVRVWPSRFLDGGWNLASADLAAMRVDGSVFLFALAAAVGAGVVFGFLPAVAAVRSAPVRELRGSGGSSARHGGRALDARAVLVTAEIALTLVLMIGAGLMLRSLGALAAVPRGYREGDVLVFDVDLPRTSAWADDRAAFYEELLSRLEAVPGVESVGMGCAAPMSGHCMITGVRRAGARTWPEGSRPPIGVHYVSDGYFRTLGITVREGRTFDSGDRADSEPVAVLSEQAARELFPDGDALGGRIAMGTSLTPESVSATVVGIVGDVLYDPPAVGTMAEAYVSHRQDEGYGTFFLRTRGDPLTVLPAARAALADLDRDLPITSARSLDDVELSASSDTRLLGGLLSGFALLALVLSCTGVWAVVAYSVSRRRAELGLRVALGAELPEVVALVVRSGLRTAVVGVALGGVAAWMGARVLRSALFEVGPSDPVTFVGGAALLVAVATLAAWIPARRATRVDPIEALRSE